ncbi:MAG: hypothetical protein HOE90_04155 [Bacteriovoracaceae bacterium]|jgi:hypothetical protein|nr:hypothetical protein [Bacteriovoracaceae bacterium]
MKVKVLFLCLLLLPTITLANQQVLDRVKLADGIQNCKTQTWVISFPPESDQESKIVELRKTLGELDPNYSEEIELIIEKTRMPKLNGSNEIIYHYRVRMIAIDDSDDIFIQHALIIANGIAKIECEKSSAGAVGGSN